MKRWEGRWSRRWSLFKWLVPGMHVKRWLLLVIAGIPLIALAAAGLLHAGDIGWPWLQTVLPGRLLPILVPALAGILLVMAGIWGFARSLLSAFRRQGQGEVVDVVYRHRQRQRGPKVVAIGGGHGLNTLLRGLKEHTDHITAIVTVADDGGSSGRLRRELGMLPPGDFRNCIAALSDAEGLMSELFQYRFGDDTDLDGHSFGNLYLSAMTAITGSFESALAESGRVLAVRGRVIPSTLAQVVLCGEVWRPTAPGQADAASGAGTAQGRWQRVCGESSLATPDGHIGRVYLEPLDVPAYPEAIRAILDADLVVIGPGSLYTSVLPNLLVSDLAQALRASTAPRVYVCNVATQPGETGGYDVSEHVRVLCDHVGADLVRVVLANNTFSSSRPPGGGADWVRLPQPGHLNYHLVTRDLVDAEYPWRHDPAKLAAAVMEFANA